ncbi:hypothetical protein C8R44DRAFT_881596 [Mycena epipterygia]|nr:hypothetical protein C8R44DRAFT_881596 [Mycena epipterygia]
MVDRIVLSIGLKSRTTSALTNRPPPPGACLPALQLMGTWPWFCTTVNSMSTGYTRGLQATSSASNWSGGSVTRTRKPSFFQPFSACCFSLGTLTLRYIPSSTSIDGAAYVLSSPSPRWTPTVIEKRRYKKEKKGSVEEHEFPEGPHPSTSQDSRFNLAPRARPSNNFFELHSRYPRGATGSLLALVYLFHLRSAAFKFAAHDHPLVYLFHSRSHNQCPAAAFPSTFENVHQSHHLYVTLDAVPGGCRQRAAAKRGGDARAAADGAAHRVCVVAPRASDTVGPGRQPEAPHDRLSLPGSPPNREVRHEAAESSSRFSSIQAYAPVTSDIYVRPSELAFKTMMDLRGASRRRMKRQVPAHQRPRGFGTLQASLRRLSSRTVLVVAQVGRPCSTCACCFPPSTVGIRLRDDDADLWEEITVHFTFALPDEATAGKHESQRKVPSTHPRPTSLSCRRRGASSLSGPVRLPRRTFLVVVWPSRSQFVFQMIMRIFGGASTDPIAGSRRAPWADSVPAHSYPDAACRAQYLEGPTSATVHLRSLGFGFEMMMRIFGGHPYPRDDGGARVARLPLPTSVLAVDPEALRASRALAGSEPDLLQALSSRFIAALQSCADGLSLASEIVENEALMKGYYKRVPHVHYLDYDLTFGPIILGGRCYAIRFMVTPFKLCGSTKEMTDRLEWTFEATHEILLLPRLNRNERFPPLRLDPAPSRCGSPAITLSAAPTCFQSTCPDFLFVQGYKW